jgi:predicted small lipoprotein YifL
MRRAVPLLLLVATVAGCGPKAPEAPAMPQAQQAQPDAPQLATLTGPVLEQLAASPYIYLRIKTPTGETWAAVPEAKIENGATVTILNPMMMAGFESKTLKRTFDAIYFGTLSGGTTPAGSGAMGAAAPVVVVDKVEKARGADARTVAESWAQREQLSGKTVTIRGVVVKYNEGVMGRNWIHLQDGSGDATKGTNDITVTSMDGVVMGATITITGTVRINKDFGAGYSYAVIVEDAKVAKP